MSARGFDHVVWAVRDLGAAPRFMERLGFRVTPRARHPWGTENHLVQLDGFFIEILGIGDETLIPEAAGDTFSFGAFNRDFLKTREGASMLVMESRDPAADRRDFERAGLHVYAPFSFGREATLPDGGIRKVGFDLTFVRNDSDPAHGFFTCLNRYPDTFWSAEYQTHPNGVTALESVVIVCDEPAEQHIFYAAFTGRREMRATSLGITLETPRGRLHLMPPAAFASLYGIDAPEIGPGGSAIAALGLRARDRTHLAQTLREASFDAVEAPEGLVLPAGDHFGLALVFD
ncbi:VOC family protein [Stappia indica]|uniref:VOC family protein n=1 Tax=Stappia indica TaxID=538381 RepID=A0A857C2U0_9HYPH|nr:VOC family protein [Stappia indica]QGZ33320.1 VOC family protein [Stappia indica]